MKQLEFECIITYRPTKVVQKVVQLTHCDLSNPTRRHNQEKKVQVYTESEAFIFNFKLGIFKSMYFYFYFSYMYWLMYSAVDRPNEVQPEPKGCSNGILSSKCRPKYSMRWCTSSVNNPT